MARRFLLSDSRSHTRSEARLFAQTNVAEEVPAKPGVRGKIEKQFAFCGRATIARFRRISFLMGEMNI